MCTHPVSIKNKKTLMYELHDCGVCIECRLKYTKAWAVRLLHEAQFYKDKCFLTLTYSPEELPKDLSLNRKHMRQFFDELRKYIKPLKIKYFYAGEYGNPESDPTLYVKENGRPHFHAIILGWYPKDAVFFKKVNGNNYYISDELKKIWRRGFSSIGNVTFKSCRYTASYAMKKRKGKQKSFYEKNGIEPEYCCMSKGIGLRYINKFKDELKKRGYIQCDGKKLGMFRYYEDKIYNEQEKEKRKEEKNEYREKNFQNFSNSLEWNSYTEFCDKYREKFGRDIKKSSWLGYKSLQKDAERERRLKEKVERSRKK
ncbi:replication initiator protein [Peromfec virus RodF8_60]|uniref:Replication initiator protein n=1 Tax=Peromfec virus RodF8_60 TaxID=2929386 RepID=A0A976N1W8_9VIRU|nr:replication initiator protein [Peromfec virus RodF8_60]